MAQYPCLVQDFKPSSNVSTTFDGISTPVTSTSMNASGIGIGLNTVHENCTR
jgi:hypothetical protein